MFNYEGQRVPQVIFQMLNEAAQPELSTADLFAHKTVVMFAVPGAFTDPHSSIQLLGYSKYAQVFHRNGVDEILCISVNDPFSLAAWAKSEGIDQVRFIPDVNGDFTRGMGILTNLMHKGMGYRSRRYSMLVRDGIIAKMFVEQESLDTVPVVSNAATMLNSINPEIEKPEQTSVLMQMWRTMLSD